MSYIHPSQYTLNNEVRQALWGYRVIRSLNKNFSCYRAKVKHQIVQHQFGYPGGYNPYPYISVLHHFEALGEGDEVQYIIDFLIHPCITPTTPILQFSQSPSHNDCPSALFIYWDLPRSTPSKIEADLFNKEFDPNYRYQLVPLIQVLEEFFDHNSELLFNQPYQAPDYPVPLPIFSIASIYPSPSFTSPPENQ